MLLAPNVVTPLVTLEAMAIDNALRVYEGSIDRAAKALGIGRATLYRRMRKHGIGSERWRPRR